MPTLDRKPRVQKKDRTGAIISLVVHVAALGVILIVLTQTKMGQELLKYGLEAVRAKRETPPPKPTQAPVAPRGPRKVAANAPPPAGSGRRTTDAPPAAESGLVVDERSESKTRSTRTSGTNQAQRVAAPPLPKPPKPPRLFASAPLASTINQLLVERSKAAASIEAIGSEQISRGGASDAGGVVNKIAGATIVDGKFAVIRGLNDRYVSTTLNGANLPSADPYRQSAPLDLFPAQVIDRIVVAKTYTPDQPGTATGGSIDVFTKSFPDRPFVSMSLGGEYNTQSSLNNRFLSYNGGGTDWAGMDDGSRALPSAINQLAPIGRRFPDAPASSGVINTPVYFQSLSNVTLIDKVSKELGVTEFGPKRETSPLNHNFSLAGGGSSFLFGQPLGYFASGSYKHDYSSYDDGLTRRYQNGTELKNSYTDARSINSVNWSTMVNLAYRPFEDQELGFTFFFNQNGSDDTRVQYNGFEQTDESATFRKFNLYYIERNLNTLQLKGDHRFNQLAGLQFNWLVAVTGTTQDEPDARFFNDIDNGSGATTGANGVPSPSKPTRYFRNLDEQNQNIKLDWSLPFRNWDEDESHVKFGLFDSHSERTFTERQFYYPGHGGYNNDPSRYLTLDNLGLNSIRTNFLRGVPRSLSFDWGDYVQIFDSLYNGTRDIRAGYMMVDMPVVPKLRFVGGVRLEKTDLFVHSESYLDSSITSKKTNDTHLVQTDPLPALGLIYSVTSNMNVRVNFSQTVARPSFRELAAYYSYDPIVSDFVEGNPTLKMSSIDNYDLRYEWFPRPGELFGVSVFYKDIKDAIERGNIKQEGDVITYRNNDAILYGIEFEARQGLGFLGYPFEDFSLGGNLSLVRSVVRLSASDLAAKRNFFPNAEDTRPLYDQSPYIFNIDLSYNNPRIGTSASMIFNTAGPRVGITKINTEDVYDQPAPVLDLVFSQKLSRSVTLKFGAKNLLNPQIERTYGKSGDLVYSSYRRGRGFGVSLTYNF